MSKVRVDMSVKGQYLLKLMTMEVMGKLSVVCYLQSAKIYAIVILC